MAIHETADRFQCAISENACLQEVRTFRGQNNNFTIFGMKIPLRNFKSGIEMEFSEY